MRKLTVILAVLLFVLTSCSGRESVKVAGEDSKTELSRHLGEVTYVLNISSGTYHIAECSVAKRIKEENRYETNDKEFITSRKFAPCKHCIGNIDG